MNGRCAIIAGLLAAIPSLACAPVPGEGRFVHIASEEAIIVWDEAAKRQHFIRRASFDTDAKDFGFLVPTPARPELGEAGDAAFAMLAEITAPRTLYGNDGRGAPKAASMAAPAAVTVLEQKMVAGLDAAVLEASDADALDAWLRKNGYPSSPQLVEWYAPYIAAQWKITAFKIAADSPKVATSAVRMSFQTEKPVFPYREPATPGAQGDRLLRVYFVADARFGGTIGEKTEWFGRPVWSKQIETGQLAQLLKLAKLPVFAGGGGRWLTEFEDRSSPRTGADDLYFVRAQDQGTLERAPRVAYGGTSGILTLVAASLAVLVAALAVYVWRRRAKNKARRMFG